jgi:hypothetical protein
MADFNVAYKISFANEGGWVNDPNDLGAETYRGISRKYNPKWAGWAYIDSLKPSGVIKKNWTDAKADDFAKAFYKASSWDAMKLDFAKSQDNANQLYDHSLSGLPRAIEQAKAVLKRKFGKNVSENQKMSESDIVALNEVDQKQFFDEYKNIRTDFFKYSAAVFNPKDSIYGDILVKYNKNPRASNQVYVNGWLNRVNKYAYTGIETAIAEVKKKPLLTITITALIILGSYILYKQIKKK